MDDLHRPVGGGAKDSQEKMLDSAKSQKRIMVRFPAKRCLPTSIHSPAKSNSAKTRVSTWPAQPDLAYRLPNATNLASPTTSPGVPWQGFLISPVSNTRVLCRSTPPRLPRSPLLHGAALGATAVTSFLIPPATVEDSQNPSTPFTISQLSSGIERGSMSYLKSEARKKKLEKTRNHNLASVGIADGLGSLSPPILSGGNRRATSGEEFAFISPSHELSPLFSPSHELLASPQKTSLPPIVDGSSEHERNCRRLPPPSLRGKGKGRGAGKGKSLRFSTTTPEFSAAVGEHQNEAEDATIGRSNPLSAEARIPDCLQTSSRLRSGIEKTTALKTYIGVVQDVFVTADLSPLDQVLEEITCELLHEYQDAISGIDMVTVRTLNPLGQLTETFRSNCNFDHDCGSQLLDFASQNSISVGATAQVPSSAQSIPSPLSSIDLQYFYAEDLVDLCGTSDEGESSDSEDWIGEDEEEVSSDPGSEEECEDDWGDSTREILEEELPKLGVYMEDESVWSKDPWAWRYADEYWHDNSSEFSHDTKFKGGASVPRPKLKGKQTPISIFNQLLDDGCIRLIVTETNRYAHASSRETKWTDVTRSELRAWLGVAIYMGICSLPQRQFHWRTDHALFRHRMIPSVMTRDRFEGILRNIHVVDNTKLNLDKSSPGFDKICKIRPFLDSISYNSRCLKDVDEQLTVDEMMILGGGRLCPIVQHNPNKPVKHGIKILATCSSSTKYVYYCQVYCGKENSQAKSVTDQTTAMLQFVPRHLNHRVTMDNWFSSVELFESLLREGILCLGTVRTNRVGWPSSINVKFDKAERGDLVWRMHRSGSIAAAMWMDHTQVALLSTCVRPEDVHCTVERWCKKLKKRVSVLTSPMLVAYQVWMRGVDVQDQLREVYSLRQKTRKWWHRLFWFAIDTAMTNAWILYKLHQKRSGEAYGTHLDFLLSLAKSLTSGYATARASAEALGTYIPPYAARAGGIHYSDRSNSRLTCAECGRRTHMACPRCRWLGLCLGQCFVLHHSRKQNCCNSRG